MVDEIRVLRLLRSVTDDLSVLREEAAADDRRRADTLWCAHHVLPAELAARLAAPWASGTSWCTSTSHLHALITALLRPWTSSDLPAQHGGDRHCGVHVRLPGRAGRGRLGGGLWLR